MSAFCRTTLATMLTTGVRALPLALDDRQIGQLLDYLALLYKWNAVYNLTAVRDPQEMVSLHVLDTLAAVPAFEHASHVLDVGAGAGLPGLVLAIARPDVRVSLIDAVHKKTAFLTQVKAELGLTNVAIHTGRVERLRGEEKFDTITSRAFAELADFVHWSGHLLAEGGHFIAFKGAPPKDEIARLPAAWKAVDVRRVTVPQLHAERHLVIIERA